MRNHNHYWLPKLDFLVSSIMVILCSITIGPSSLGSGCISAILSEQKLWNNLEFSLEIWSLKIWSHLLNKSLVENFIFCVEIFVEKFLRKSSWHGPNYKRKFQVDLEFLYRESDKNTPTLEERRTKGHWT